LKCQDGRGEQRGQAEGGGDYVEERADDDAHD
jgi:hypothetical protein